jgi:hypothetical protein
VVELDRRDALAIGDRGVFRGEIRSKFHSPDRNVACRASRQRTAAPVVFSK